MPPREVSKLLFDVVTACDHVRKYTQGKSFADYEEDSVLRSAVERQIAIIGEAFNQALRIDDSIETAIPNIREIIATRHILVHGYSNVSNATIWGIVENDIEPLTECVAGLLQSDP